MVTTLIVGIAVIVVSLALFTGGRTLSLRISRPFGIRQVQGSVMSSGPRLILRGGRPEDSRRSRQAAGRGSPVLAMRGSFVSMPEVTRQDHADAGLDTSTGDSSSEPEEPPGRPRAEAPAGSGAVKTKTSSPTRLSVNLGTGAAEALRELMERKGINATEAIRRALSTWKFIEDARRDGRSIALLEGHGKDQVVREVVFHD